MPSKEVDGFVRALLNDGPFDPAEAWQEIAANEVLDKIKAIRIDTERDELDIEIDIEYEEQILRSYMISYVYGGEDSFEVPKDELQHALKYPVNQVFIASEHRAKITGPNKAIRAKCMECQGLNQVFIRHCTTINCQLWPFRMGTNPMYGRLAGVDEDTEIVDTEAEIEAMEATRAGHVE